MHAVIETGGKQYRVTVGLTIEVEKLLSSVGEKVPFPVLLVENSEGIRIGSPTLEGVKAIGEVVSHKKGRKLIAYTYRRRKGSERKVGHRQPLTVVKITDIVDKGAL